MLMSSKVLVIGAGALGNEVIKNLAMLGVGNVVVADMDLVEESNLSRSILFREGDVGKSKANCAARAAREIWPEINIRSLTGNVLAEVGLGYFLWADVVIGALDNREARVFVNSTCARLGRPWFDGGIEVLQGVVRGFFAPRTACYECTMSKVDWELINQRRSCSLLARRALAERGIPTTPTTASIIAGMQVTETVKYLHGLPSLLGRGFVYEGTEHSSYAVNYPINPECPWHEEPPEVESLPLASDTPWRTIFELLEKRLGKLDAVELSREIVAKVECSDCQQSVEIWKPAEAVQADRLKCSRCGKECSPVFLHSIVPGQAGQLLERTPGNIGLPPWDVFWARRGEEYFGFEIAGDNPWQEKTNRAHSPKENF